MDRFEVRMDELIEISNEVNNSTCAEVAAAVVSAAKGLAEPISVSHAYQQSIQVLPPDPRTGIGDWAHQRVGATAPHAARVESRHGILARALGSV